MSATLVWRAVLVSLLCTSLFVPMLAAQSGGAYPSTTACNLDDGRQVYVRYNAVSSKEKPANGKPWVPGGQPMTLFTEAQLTLEARRFRSALTRCMPFLRKITGRWW